MRRLADKEICGLTTRFLRTGVVQIPSFLSDHIVAKLLMRLRQGSDWVRTLNDGDSVFEFDRSAQDAWSDDQRAALESRVYANARAGFQYRYECIRVADSQEERSRSEDLLARLAEELSSGPVRELLRTITARPDIDFADLQATSYSPGDFLTAHDDNVAGKGRVAAYTLGLTPQWRPEWGGLLMIRDRSQQLQTIIPELNTLTIFHVPLVHWVSEVTRAAALRRFMLTGWLRSDRIVPGGTGGR